MARLVPDRRWVWQVGIQLGVLAAVGAVLWSLARVEGLVLVAVVGLVWLVASTEYAVAIGLVLYAVLLAPALETPLVGAAAFGGLFLAEFAGRWPWRSGGLGVLAFALAGLGLGSAWRFDPQWQGLALLFVGFAVVSYGIHRSELVVLGLVEGEEEAT